MLGLHNTENDRTLTHQSHQKFDYIYQYPPIMSEPDPQVRGYLNWMQDWFLLAAREKCRTVCIVSENKAEVSGGGVTLQRQASAALS